MGVLRWRSRLDDEIAHASSQPLAKLDLEILIALRLALYQFRWLDRVPQRAALHESVELVKRARKRSAAPFVNAVLRKLSATSAAIGELSTDAVSPRSPGRSTRAPALAGRTLGPRIRPLRRSPDLPTRSVHSHDSNPPPHPNRRSRTRRRKESLSPPAPSSHPPAASKPETSRRPQAFRTGQIVIQDEASQLVAALVGSTPEQQDHASSTAAPPPAARRSPSPTTIPKPQSPPSNFIPTARACSKSCCTANRAALDTRIQIVVADAQRSPHLARRSIASSPTSPAPAPARSPAIPKSNGASPLDDLAELARSAKLAILRSALAQVAPGGRLIYSTCSLEKEENENVVEQALAENKSFRLLDCRTELDRLKASGRTNLARSRHHSPAAPTSAPSPASTPATASSPQSWKKL